MAGDWMSAYKDPRWQRRRLEIMESANFACEYCCAETKTLNVHHRFYKKNAQPWEYPNEALMCLCQDCHEELHAIKDRIKDTISIMVAHELDVLSGFAHGLLLSDGGLASQKLMSAEHASGIGKVFGLTGQEIFELSDEDYIVTSEALAEKRKKNNG